MKVIQIVSNKFWGGGERYVFDLSRSLREEGCDVEIVVRGYNGVAERFLDDAFSVSVAPLGGFIDIISPRRIAKIINSSKDNRVIIHCHNFKDAITALRARRLTHRTKVGVVVTRHLVKVAKTDLLHRGVYQGIDRIIFVSGLAMDTFLSSNPPIDRGKLSVVHNSVKVDTAAMRVEPEPTSGGHQLKLLFVGRVCRDKGIEVLLDALKSLKDENLTLDVVGTGDDSYVELLKQKADDNGISERVNWLRFREDVHPFIESADVAVCPSIVREACPLSVLECMAHGKAVIASDNGGQAEFVASGRNGVLVPPGDAEALAEAIRALVASPELRLQLGRYALSDFRETLSYPVFTAKMQKIYGDILGER